MHIPGYDELAAMKPGWTVLVATITLFPLKYLKL
jgi:hypothetical protein